MTRRMVNALIFTIAACSSASVWAASGREALLVFADKTTTAQGEFVQKVTDKKGESAGSDSAGTFVFERPGKFVWETKTPYPQTIVSDAKTVYVWDPDLNQVTVRKLTEAMSATPAAILFGKGDIEKSFRLKDMGSDGGLDWVAAEPLVEDLTYRRFEIGFDAKGVMASMRLFDHFGQTVTLTFRDVKTNGKIEAGAFDFKIPSGADVLQDTH